MTDVAYVILSDLHFGAANSLLSRLADGDPDQVRGVDTSQPSPVMAAMLEGLRGLLRANTGGPATLVLAGDVLDLALSTDDVAATVFEQFAHEAFDPAREQIFAPGVLYLPGNHDHHLWEAAREGQYVQFIEALEPGRPLTPAWHSTRMRLTADRRVVSSTLLTALARRATGSPLQVEVVYPNLALEDGGDRCVVVHHGHYTESIYTLMSALKDLMFPSRQARSPHVWEWEAENFAWIDFFWGTLGRSGDVGDDVGLVYAQLASETCVDHYVRNLVTGLVGHERAPHWLRDAERTVVSHLADWLVGRRSTLERSSTTSALSDKGWAGLDAYLGGPVLDQLGREFPEVPSDVRFVFGHTHKPFEATRRVAGVEAEVDVYNTGGWVVDASVPAPTHGGAAVLVSGDLQVASLRLFNQTADGSPSAVTVEGTDPWVEELRGRVAADRATWDALATVAATAVVERHRLSAAFQRLD